jgi:hypothetical protein
MLARYSGAAGGLLYAHGDRGLVPIGALGGAKSDAKIEAWAKDYFRSESADREVTRSIFESQITMDAREWQASSGDRYIPVLLSHQSARGFALTGLAVLVVARGAQFIYPSRFAAELSRATLDTGDTTAAYV